LYYSYARFFAGPKWIVRKGSKMRRRAPIVGATVIFRFKNLEPSPIPKVLCFSQRTGVILPYRVSHIGMRHKLVKSGEQRYSRELWVSESQMPAQRVIVYRFCVGSEKQSSLFRVSVRESKDFFTDTSTNYYWCPNEHPRSLKLTIWSGYFQNRLSGGWVIIGSLLLWWHSQEGQQWGDEFGIEVDEYSVNRVEIYRGPPVYAMALMQWPLSSTWLQHLLCGGHR